MRDEPPNRSLDCDVTVLAGDWPAAIPDAVTLVERAVRGALAKVPAARLPEGALEVSAVLADDETVQRLNRDFRGKDSPTNVLSFAEHDAATPPVPDAPAFLGEIVLALETLCAEATAQGKTAADHVVHLTVHGVLHLLDYDHERGPEEAAEMETQEVAILAGLGIGDPYGDADTALSGDPS